MTTAYATAPKITLTTPPSRPLLDLNVRIGCSDCNDPQPPIVEDFAAGDLICGNCGLVLGDRIIDTRSEWRTFSNDEGGDDPSRVGAAADPLLGGNQLDTVISRRDGGSGSARDLSKIQAKSVSLTKGDRNVLKAFKEISSMCDHIGLPKIIADISKQIYKRVEDEKLVRGKSNEVVMAACIFIACRQENVPRTFKEICALTRVPKKEIGRCFKLLCRELETDVKGMSGKDLIVRFCSNLGVGMEVEKAASELALSSRDISGLAGKSPVSVAAACIYLVCNLHGVPRSAKEISEIAGVSEITIKGAYKFLYLQRHLLVKGNVSLLPSP
jgi:transcription initiation factor TFIIB